MATLTQSVPMRRAQTGYPPSSLRFDWIVAALSMLLLTGLNIDIWAHNHDKVDDSFFTPWHAIMYGSFLIFGAFLTIMAMRNIRQGHGLLNALPRGYVLSLFGLQVFALGGVGDLIWHTVFGIEESTEALLSPTHLILGMGFFILFSGTIRAAWFRPVSPGSNRWMQLLPAILGMAACVTLLMAFTQFANSTYNGAYATFDWSRPGSMPSWLWLPLGISSIVLHTALTMGALLFLIGRWRLPFGAATLLFVIPGLYIAAYQDTYSLLPGMLIAGLIADVLLSVLRPGIGRTLQTAVFAFIVPVIYNVAFFITIQLVEGVGWRIHSWFGAIMFAGVTGLLLALFITVRPDSSSMRSETVQEP